MKTSLGTMLMKRRVPKSRRANTGGVPNRRKNRVREEGAISKSVTKVPVESARIPGIIARGIVQEQGGQATTQLEFPHFRTSQAVWEAGQQIEEHLGLSEEERRAQLLTRR
jgi:hypothetical protein